MLDAADDLGELAGAHVAALEQLRAVVCAPDLDVVALEDASTELTVHRCELLRAVGELWAATSPDEEAFAALDRLSKLGYRMPGPSIELGAEIIRVCSGQAIGELYVRVMDYQDAADALHGGVETVAGGGFS